MTEITVGLGSLKIKKFISDLKGYINEINCKPQIEILDSKKRLYLQLVDLVVSKYKELYLFDDVDYLSNLKKKIEYKK